MRRVLATITAVMLAGCAAPAQKASEPVAVPLTSSSSASSALAFDPPVTQFEPTPDLSRSTHGTAAFAGFEDTTTTYFYVRTDDRQTQDDTGRFEREGYLSKVGAIRR
jgi:hypothetical protein